jgi:glutamine synthetase
MESSFNKYTTRFNSLPAENESTIAEYIWIGGTGFDLRSKTMCIPKKITKIEDFPIWNYDGSSTLQATTESSEIHIKPVFYCPDPFRHNSGEDRNERAYLVLCETYTSDFETPAKANFRYYAKKIFEEAVNEKPWFGFEQEYILLQHEGTYHKWPIGFPKGGFAYPQGQYYCSVGSTNAIGRYVAEAHMRCCLAAGIQISGLNAEVFPGQWEFQVGPVEGLQGCDQLWIARYILKRVCEEFDVDVTFEPKPVKGDWNGSGCHTNFSFESTRNDGGYDRILDAMKLLTERHNAHITVYGPENNLRLTGHHETASIDKFNYGVANRGSSARIPTKTALEKKGYFEDRRPSANCDPYLVGAMLVDTTILRVKHGDEIVQAYKKFAGN